MTSELIERRRREWWDRLTAGDRLHLVGCMYDDKLDDRAVELLSSHGSPIGAPVLWWENQPDTAVTVLTEDLARFLLARSAESDELGYVAVQAMRWAAGDTMMRWINDAKDGPMPVADTIKQYLGSNNPFPADTQVEVRRPDPPELWELAVIVERTDTNEWLVEYPDGGGAWRDHSELRPAGTLGASQ